MKEFKLISGEIFSDEFEACKTRNNQNTPEERELISGMARAIEDLFSIDETKSFETIAAERDYKGNDGKYYFELLECFENNQGTYPYFYCTGTHVPQYALCREVVRFDDKETFDLFLFFKLRNLSLHGLIKWLDGLHKVHGAAFLPFLKLHLDVYGPHYKELHLKNLRQWLEEGNNKALTGEPTILSNIEKDTAQGVFTKNSELPQLTNAQWAYLFYFFLKHYGLEVRGAIEVAPVAKLIHLTLGKTFTKLSNSDIYKILSKAPSYHKSTKRNIEDMKIVKEALKQFELNEIAKSIDETIQKEKNY